MQGTMAVTVVSTVTTIMTSWSIFYFKSNTVGLVMQASDDVLC